MWKHLKGTKVFCLIVSILLVVNSTAIAIPIQQHSLRTMSSKLSYAEQLLQAMKQKANAQGLLSICEVAERIGIMPDELQLYTHLNAAKVDLSLLKRLKDRPNGYLIIVTAMTPTLAGIGKTTIEIVIAQGLAYIGKTVVATLREPSLGPTFGFKGGATGSGKASIEPAEEINMHFTGDINAVEKAHNLLAAAVAKHLYYRNKLDGSTRNVINPETITWPRAMDMCDRELREMRLIMARKKSPDMVRDSQFIITAASEIMAILALSRDENDLIERLGRITVGYDYDGNPVTAKDLNVVNAMAVLLKDAIKPNLVQTTEGQPVLVHAGPFANIAHGNNSVIATNMALKITGPGGFVVTEGGFGTELGAEKFYDIVARQEGYKPNLTVLVVTARALKMHGGMSQADAMKKGDDSQGTLSALKRGFANLDKHIENIEKFGVPVLVAINRFPDDTNTEIELIKKHCLELMVMVELSEGVTKGGAGGADLARAAVEIIENIPSRFKPLYELELSIRQKIETVAREIYGADGVEFSGKALNDIEKLEKFGLGKLPICIAKTPYSLSDDKNLQGAPKGCKLEVREIKASTGAGFLVVIAGDVMLMPGLTQKSRFETMENPFRANVFNALQTAA